MVSKLLLANCEAVSEAIASDADKKLIDRLTIHFHQINDGIGVNKSPDLYGAFPTDPYSHTPKGKGAQQPGMTGQVKEDLLSRSGELGVKIKEGTLSFEPVLLRDHEFIEQGQLFSYVDVLQKKNQIQIEPKSLAFTICQVPVVYQKSDENVIEVYAKDGSVIHFKGNKLDVKTSQSLFSRSGEYQKMIVFLDILKI
jgi:hypothetical protein